MCVLFPMHFELSINVAVNAPYINFSPYVRSVFLPLRVTYYSGCHCQIYQLQQFMKKFRHSTLLPYLLCLPVQPYLVHYESSFAFPPAHVPSMLHPIKYERRNERVHACCVRRSSSYWRISTRLSGTVSRRRQSGSTDGRYQTLRTGTCLVDSWCCHGM